MSRLQHPDPIKLLASVLSNDIELIGETMETLSQEFGSTDYISELLPFDYTDYYGKEMGYSLIRRFVSFENLVHPGNLPDVKLFTNRVEEQYTVQERRRVNIDPGYIAQGHLILATGKRYAHRPYLRKGIYADLTLIFENRTFKPLEWTYPDYREHKTIQMLIKIRQKYSIQLADFKREAQQTQ